MFPVVRITVIGSSEINTSGGVYLGSTDACLVCRQGSHQIHGTLTGDLIHVSIVDRRNDVGPVTGCPCNRDLLARTEAFIAPVTGRSCDTALTVPSIHDKRQGLTATERGFLTNVSVDTGRCNT